MHIADCTTETVHGEGVPGGDIETNIDGKPTMIDIQQLRNRIPPHCFEPCTVISFLYVAHDVAIFLVLLKAALYFEGRLSGIPRLLLCYAVYPYLAGLPLTGLWVLAHECGHGAFSPNELVAHPVGFLIHSALMSPYFSWRSGHVRHHHPGRTTLEDVAEDAPVAALLRILLQQIVGGPWYVLTHMTAGSGSSPKPEFCRMPVSLSPFSPHLTNAHSHSFLSISLSTTQTPTLSLHIPRGFGTYTVSCREHRGLGRRPRCGSCRAVRPGPAVRLVGPRLDVHAALDVGEPLDHYDHIPTTHISISPQGHSRVLDVPAGRAGGRRPGPGPCAPVHVSPHCRFARGAPLVPTYSPL